MIRIILVDDEQLALERLRCLVQKKEGYEIVGEFTDSEQALQEAGNLQPDIVITDICMVGYDGLEMVERMRAAWGEKFAFVIVSGYGEFDYAKRALELGIKDYILKPVIETEFFEVLEQVKRELEVRRYKRAIAVETESENEYCQRGNKKLLERLVEEIVRLHIEEAEKLVEEIFRDYSETSSGSNVRERHLLLLTRLLDEKLEYKGGRFQNLWTQKSERGVLDQESVLRFVRRCILMIMEEKESYKVQPVEYMKLYIQLEYASEISLQDFADKIYMNKAYLGQKFKKETGMSMNDYLQEKRIQESLVLADTTELLWQTISAKVGYVNYLSFLKYFTKYKGILPTDYRE